MAYRVDLTPRAVYDIESAVEYISQVASTRVKGWLLGLMELVDQLDEMPERFAICPESEEVGKEIRHILYGKRTGVYRIIFHIYQEAPGTGVVQVLSVRHGSRDRLLPEDLDE